MYKKTVLVTGNLGFIGMWLTKSLLRNGYKVFGIDNRSSYGERLVDEVALVKEMEKQYNFDISDLDAMKEAVIESKPSLVINMAGQAIVPRAFKEPFMTYRTNALGTLSVIEAARQTRIPKVVVAITSDKVYKNFEQIWPYRENDPLGGKDIYSVSKSCAELICSAYVETHLADTSINIQTVRLGNVVGGGDWSKNRLIPDIMNSVKSGDKFYIRYPNATRPYQHVLDVVDGVMKISNAALNGAIKSGEGWNLGPRNNTYAKVSDVVDLCKKTWPYLTFEQNPDPIPEDQNLSVEIAKFKSVFGEPKYTSIEAIEFSLRWYERYFRSVPALKLIDEDFLIYENA